MILRSLCAGVVLCGALQGQTKPVEAPANYTTRSGVVYTQGAVGPLKAEVYVPNGTGPFPGIVFIHGGGWVDGNRYQMSRLAKELANAGYVGFAIEYDVDPVNYPASFHESLAAVNYFRAHAGDYHLDPARVGVGGSSAGGELAALVALNPAPKDDVADAIKPVQAAVLLNGVLDLQTLGDKSEMVSKYLGGLCSAKAALCAEASPMAQVHAGAPPFYVGHGTADEVVPFLQAEKFVGALRADKVQVRFFTAQGGPHTYWLKEQFFAANLAELKGFLALALRERNTQRQ